MKPILTQILEKVPPKRRMLIFKRSIIKIANKIAEKENTLAITM
jgi:adenylyl- and sulfurtransferase ThiI